MFRKKLLLSPKIFSNLKRFLNIESSKALDDNIIHKILQYIFEKLFNLVSNSQQSVDSKEDSFEENNKKISKTNINSL